MTCLGLTHLVISMQINVYVPGCVCQCVNECVPCACVCFDLHTCIIKHVLPRWNECINQPINQLKNNLFIHINVYIL